MNDESVLNVTEHVVMMSCAYIMTISWWLIVAYDEWSGV